jgi:hypothetical protein
VILATLVFIWILVLAANYVRHTATLALALRLARAVGLDSTSLLEHARGALTIVSLAMPQELVRPAQA